MGRRLGACGAPGGRSGRRCPRRRDHAHRAASATGAPPPATAFADQRGEAGGRGVAPLAVADLRDLDAVRDAPHLARPDPRRVSPRSRMARGAAGVLVLLLCGLSAAAAQASPGAGAEVSENPVRSNQVVISWPAATGSARVFVFSFTGEQLFTTTVPA